MSDHCQNLQPRDAVMIINTVGQTTGYCQEQEGYREREPAHDPNHNIPNHLSKMAVAIVMVRACMAVKHGWGDSRP